MGRLPTLSIGEAFDEARKRLRKRPGTHMIITLVNADDDEVTAILTTDNPAMLANVASNALQLTVEASDVCDCENCQLASGRCREALKAWPPTNVLPFKPRS